VKKKKKGKRRKQGEKDEKKEKRGPRVADHVYRICNTCAYPGGGGMGKRWGKKQRKKIWPGGLFLIQFPFCVAVRGRDGQKET